MIIDTHSHLNFKAYNNDRNEVIKRNLENGVVCIDVGVNYKTSKSAVELAKTNKDIFASIGLHPSEISEEFNKEKYLELAKNKKVIAIGEIGLDYFRNPDKENQKQIFIKQLDLAKELNLPVIIHCRMAHEDVLNILKNYKLRGVIHCFTGNIYEMKKYIDLGFYIGLTGIIFKLNLDEVIKNCPLGKILVETDCPYLTPPMAGVERNEPIFVKHIIQKIADIKQISFDQIAIATTQNAKSLFDI